MIEKICRNLNIKYEKDVSLAEHTTFRIGGKADYLVSPPGKEELAALLKKLKANNIPFFIIGRGSNILVSDSGVRGVVVQMSEGFKHIEYNGSEVRAGAGVPLPRLLREASGKGLKGLEFAWGIPGSLGGSLIMNAGAYGSCMGNVVKEVLILTQKDELKKLRKEEIIFRYRGSTLKDEGHIVLEAVLSLEEGDGTLIREKVSELKKKRKESQPPQPSAGSIFRNPSQAAAGKLIEDAGLKGKTLGGAAISEIHANFIVNKGGARAAEVLELINIAKEEVKKIYDIDLKLEIEVIGEKKSI